MGREDREYSVAELVDHPVVIGAAMRAEGIEWRSLELMLDEMRRDRHHASEPVDSRM
jgi:hypothetical protein